MTGKVLRDYQNRSKALEIKLERATPGKYNVTLSGITINANGRCTGGTCEGAFADSQTYINETYAELHKAEEVYKLYKERYVE